MGLRGSCLIPMRSSPAPPAMYEAVPSWVLSQSTSTGSGGVSPPFGPHQIQDTGRLRTSSALLLGAFGVASVRRRGAGRRAPRLPARVCPPAVEEPDPDEEDVEEDWGQPVEDELRFFRDEAEDTPFHLKEESASFAHDVEEGDFIEVLPDFDLRNQDTALPEEDDAEFGMDFVPEYEASYGVGDSEDSGRSSSFSLDKTMVGSLVLQPGSFSEICLTADWSLKDGGWTVPSLGYAFSVSIHPAAASLHAGRLASLELKATCSVSSTGLKATLEPGTSQLKVDCASKGLPCEWSEADLEPCLLLLAEKAFARDQAAAKLGECRLLVVVLATEPLRSGAIQAAKLVAIPA